ncbi:hypothetical protein NQ318_007694 [Aromia moschata]|uniref:Uncharacterized protein n=1 Tax=Aromia moschata TaxID=1265417 RepID=A0AAV8XK81_9CUCU|nr:hypothetical protein NQ318_007694 [Aromia moschata]
MAILDVSKTCVYDFHYNFMLKNYSLDRCKLLYTDTDSLINELKSDNVYKELTKNISSNLILAITNQIIGLMKDECFIGLPITHFIGLRSKITQHCMKSILHDIYSIKQTKIALNPFDDKRCRLKDSTNTLPWGHFSILQHAR